jgi:uncharacterized membrane protein
VATKAVSISGSYRLFWRIYFVSGVPVPLQPVNLADFLTILDILIVILTWMEYRRMRR